MPSTEELRDLLSLNGMLNADAKDINNKLSQESASKMGVRGVNPKEMLTKVGGAQALNAVLPSIQPPQRTIKVETPDGIIEVPAPAPLIPMDDIPTELITGKNSVTPQQFKQEVVNELPQIPKDQQEFTFVDNLGKKVSTIDQILEYVENINFRISSIDSRIKKIEDYLINRKKRV